MATPLISVVRAVTPEVSIRSSAPDKITVDFPCENLQICEGPGSLHAVMISNAGCCRFVVRDGSRPLFRMLSAFSGSFFLEAGFNTGLWIDLDGEMAAHLDISFRKASQR